MRAKYEQNDSNLTMYYLGGENNQSLIELILTNDYDDIFIPGCTNPDYLNYNPLANYDSGFCNNETCFMSSTCEEMPLNILTIFNK